MLYNEKVSVIIPTTRTHTVRKTVQSVVRQTDNHNYEIILAGRDLFKLRNCFSDDNIIFVDSENRCSPSKSRNIGASAAKGDVLLFIDDDCEAAIGWFKNSLRILVDPSVGVVTGKILGKSNRFFAKCVDLNFYLQQGNEPGELNRFSSVTFGIKKQLFNELGGFDEHIEVREDIDFSKRVIDSGYKIVYSPDILVIHDHKRDSFGKYLSYQYKSGLLSGLSVSMKHKKDWKNYVRVNLKNFYLLLVLPLAIWSTYKQVAFAIRCKKNIFLFLPFIFLSNVCYQLGVFKWTISYKR